MFGRASSRCESHLRVSCPAVPPHYTPEPFPKLEMEPKVGIEQLSGEGCSTIAPHDSKRSLGRYRFSHSGTELCWTFRHNPQRSAVVSSGRCRPRRDHLSLEPPARPPSPAASLRSRIDAEEWRPHQLHRSHRPLRVDGGRLQHLLHLPRRRSGMDLRASAALPVSPYGNDVCLGLSVSTGP